MKFTVKKRKKENRGEKMLREICTCVIILGVISINWAAQNHTEVVAVEIESKLFDLRETLEKVSKDGPLKFVEDEIDMIYDEWKKSYVNLSYYINHADLGKIDLNLISAKSLIDAGEYTVAMSEIDKCIYELGYMNERYKINISNIF